MVCVYWQRGGVATFWTFLVNSVASKTMADKLMYMPNDDTQNHSFCRLKAVGVETFGHSTKRTNQ